MKKIIKKPDKSIQNTISEIDKSIERFNQHITSLNQEKSRLQNLSNQIPNLCINSAGQYYSDTIKDFTGVDFTGLTAETLYASPYKEIAVVENGKSNILKVRGVPNKIVLAFFPLYGYAISFSKLEANLKKYQFNEDILRQCIDKIIEYIGNNPNRKLDTKNLSPTLQKLLNFL